MQFVIIFTMCRINLSILLLLTLSLSLAKHLNPFYSYKDYEVEFSRRYQGAEREGHEANFNTNYIKLLELQMQGSDVTVTNFTDWNQTQIDAFFNYRKQDKVLTQSKRPVKSSETVSNPTNFNWMDKQAVTSVKDQSYCGSCWSFATTAQYESLLAIQMKGEQHDLAEQFALQCQTNSHGCTGGYPNYALNLIIKDGIEAEEDYPYKPQDGYYSKLGKNICDDPNKIKLKSSQVSTAYYVNLTVSQIQSDLINYGPLTVGISGSDYAFQSVGSTGFITACSQFTNINHVVLLYGYTQTHWLIKNSWGTSWGDNGHAYVLKTNDCGISQEIFEIQGVKATTKPVNISVKLTDSGGDGWNGFSIGFKQRQTIVGSFGETFTSGSSQGPISLQIQSTQMTDIVVSGKGQKSNQIGFIVYDALGKKIFERQPGQSFTSMTIFKSFCPSQACSENQNYKLTMFDTFGDGWNQNNIAFKYENGTELDFPGQSQQFMAKQKNIKISSHEKIKVYANYVDEWSNQIGYKLTTSSGLVVLSRTPGIAIKQPGVLSTFCIGCANIQSPIINNETNQTNQTSAQTKESIIITEPQDYQSYKIATYSLAGVSGILLIGVIFTTFKVMKTSPQETIPATNNSNPLMSEAKLGQQTNPTSSVKNTDQIFPGPTAQPTPTNSNKQSSEGHRQSKQKVSENMNDVKSNERENMEPIHILPPLNSNIHNNQPPYQNYFSQNMQPAAQKPTPQEIIIVQQAGPNNSSMKMMIATEQIMPQQISNSMISSKIQSRYSQAPNPNSIFIGPKGPQNGS